MRDIWKHRAISTRRTRRIRTAGIVAATALAVVLTGCSGNNASTGSSSSGSDKPFASLYKKALATNGGKVTLYTHLSGIDQQAAIRQAFETEYPGINLQITGLNGQALLARFETEKQAGKSVTDVIQYPGLQPFETKFKEQDWIKPFTPASAKAYTTKGTFIKGYAYPWSIYEQGACYNPNKVSKKDLKLLQTYKGWADPTWKGRAAISLPNGGTYLRGWTYWVEQDKSLGVDWLKDIKKNVDPVAFSDGNNAANEVAAGEYAVAFGVNSVDAIRAQRAGGPLQCARQQYTVVIPAAMGLVAKSPNPAGGKLFIDWQLSESGQRASMLATGNLSARNDLVGVPPAGIKDWTKPKKEVSTDEAVVTKTQEQLTGLFSKLFGAGQ